MADNPYLSSQPEGNPYLQAAIDQVDNKIIDKLSQLVPESSTTPQGSYRSALETSDLKDSSEDKPKTKRSILGNSAFGAYRSPDEVLQEEAIRQQQEHQAAIQQKNLERERNKQLEAQARAFLKKLDTLDPLNSERMWFESFANSCASRLEAAIEFVKTI